MTSSTTERHVIQVNFLRTVGLLVHLQPTPSPVNLLVFPHQLFSSHPGLKKRPSRVVIIEDSLFFGDASYPAKFHKQKLWLHRATMKRYQEHLDGEGLETLYVDYDPQPRSLLRQLEQNLQGSMTIFECGSRNLLYPNKFTAIECQKAGSPSPKNSDDV